MTARRVTVLIFIIIILVFVAKVSGNSKYGRLNSMISMLVFIDLIVAFAVTAAGFRVGSPGMIAGGAICGLIALGSSPAVAEPRVITLILQIMGLVVGVGSAIVSSARRTLD